MSVIPKAYLGIFLIFLQLVIAIGLISADMNTANAISFHADCMDEIENSNLSDSVIHACKVSANEQGYELVVTPVTDDNGNRIMAEVVLKYDYGIPLLNVLTTHEKRGYAR